jgi:hypothetical protein
MRTLHLHYVCTASYIAFLHPDYSEFTAVLISLAVEDLINTLQKFDKNTWFTIWHIDQRWAKVSLYYSVIL